MSHRSFAMSCVVLVSLSASAWAQSRDVAPFAERPLKAGEWEYSLTPYLWFPSVGNASFDFPGIGAGGTGGTGGGGGGKGEGFTTNGVGGGGVGSSLSVEDDSDFFDDLGISPNVHFEVRSTPWIFYVDGRYLNQDVDGSTNGGASANLDFELWMGEIGAGYQVYDWKTDAGGRGGHWDVFVGLRGTSLDTDISTSAGTSIEVDSEWLDVMIGTRVCCEVAKDWTVCAEVEIGGFGIGDSNDFTWEAAIGVGYAVTDCVDVQLGYRAMGLHRDQSSVEFDLVFHGPTIGVNFRF
jgi:opacity protein-like surface antigen